MSATRVIPDSVRNRQVSASNPAVSAWVAANAGSGKTHVLAQRVIRLLLQDFDPARILCITFTKAAAANMANRVFDTLRQWTAFDDAALDEAIRLISNEKPGPELRARARRLFALALETPGGLKVQTIHAFCTHLLHLFPFEANVPARFTVMDEAQQNQLLEQLTLDVLLTAAADSEGPLGKALSTAIAAAADVTFRDLVREAVGERARLSAWIDSAGGVEEAIAKLSRALGIDPNDSDEAVNAAFIGASPIAPSEWSAIAAALADGQKTDRDQSMRFASLKTAAETDRIERYIEIFCTKELAPRKSIATKAIRDADPALHQQLFDEQERVCRLLDRRRAIAARDRTRALVTVADAVLARYRAEKARRGLLDYDDLIDRARALLENVSSAWVHYKLDRGIDHVLIDEAQDTSPRQWAIVRALTAEFFAGEGVPRRRRTIFAVGDEKQSIFSFQGAAPREFDRMQREFDRLSKAAELRLEFVRFDHSFRSGANVLAAVDAVFERKEIYASVTSDADGVPDHIALPHAAPGLVEIWDTEKPSDRREIEGWDAPFDEVTETSPIVRLARRIAAHVKAWRQRGRKAGDVLVLVRRRGPLFEAVIRSLKSEGIPVAGADRLTLSEHIAVMDLMTLADALLLPDDDLALATVLKSPLFGLDDDALFALAFGRKGSLRNAVRAQRPDLSERLDALARAARERSPFAFFAGLLGAGGGRKAFQARLGHEATDALDEFLNLAFDYERLEAPSLQGFMAWMRAAKSEIKRDMEMARDEVRVMTVHGAKGLEAPIVVLADTTTPPHGWHPPRLLEIVPASAVPGAAGCLVWAGPKTADVGAMAAAREAARDAARDEYRRLLYVAMTRASERLVVCGADGERTRADGCWYDLVRATLEPAAVMEPADDGAGEMLRYRKAPDHAGDSLQPGEAPAAAIALPAWLTRDVAPEPARSASIAPSGFVARADADDRATSAGARQRALMRGTIVHRLLQSLPDIEPGRRADAIWALLKRQKEIDDPQRGEIAGLVERILADPRFAALFAPGSQGELSIAGRLGDRHISGQVDRLAVTQESVLIADYKTNRPAPRSLREALDCHRGYVIQLALYRAVLQRLYPDRPVRAALLWTDTPELMEIPTDLLDSACAEALTLRETCLDAPLSHS